MPKACAVPKCNTGRRTIKEKYSVFKVPSDNEQYKKWQAAIPSIVNLKQSQFVCEKHFENKYILRKRIHRNSNNEIIAEVPYKHSRLDPSAVPSIFDSNNNSYCSSMKSSPMEYVDAQMNDSVVKTSASTNNLTATTEISRTDDMNCSVMGSTDHQIEESFSQDIITDGTSIMDLNDSENVHLKLQHDMLSPIKVTPIESTQAQDHPMIHTMEVRSLSFDRITKVTISNCDTDIASSAIGNTYFTISKLWGVSEFMADEAETIIFSLFAKKIENGLKMPVPLKIVTVSADKTLHYFVYGRVIDAQEHNLAQTSVDTKLLPQILETFQSMTVCNGLGTININHLSGYNIFKDYIGEWRPNNCSFISKMKRCARCIQMRRLTWKWERRLKIKTSVKLNYIPTLNPMDQGKITAHRKNNLRDRRRRNRAQQRV